jgi:anti-anti-sigma regulatory factor/HAMP domain-containing protein
MRLRLSHKFALSIGGLLLALAVSVSVLSFREARAASRDALERQGDAISMTLAYAVEVLLDDEDLTSVQRIATNSILLSNVREVVVTDLAGKVLVSGDRIEVGKPTRSRHLQAYLDQGGGKALTVENDASELLVIRPLRRGKYTTALDSGLIGAVQITMDQRETRAKAFAAARRQLSIHLGGYALLGVVITLILNSLVVTPLYRLAGAARRIRKGDRAARSRIETRDEIGIVSSAFDEMAGEVERTVASLEDDVKARTADLQREVEARTAALEELRRGHEEVKSAHDHVTRAHEDLARAHAELKASADERLRLLEAVRELSAPVIRAHRDIVVMPLVGHIDPDRAKQIETALLTGIARHRARVVILDLTGVPLVDTHVMESLLRAVRSGELLGARVIFAGMSPGLATSAVEMDRSLSGIVAYSNLEKALTSSFRGLGFASHLLKRAASRASFGRRPPGGA